MGLGEALILAAALGLDSFAVAAGVGMTVPKVTFRLAFRISWHFALFQMLMLAGGWYLGVRLGSVAGGSACWVAAGLLWIVGGRMIWEFYEGLDRVAHPSRGVKDPSRGIWLVILSLSTSIDALAAGAGLGLLTGRIWYPAVVILVATMCMAAGGLLLGEGVGRKLGRSALLAGGLVLCGLGAKIILDHWL